MEEKAMVVKTQSKSKRLYTAGKLALFAVATALTLGPIQARAEGDIDDLFAAANLTSLHTNVKALLMIFVGINILFLGYKYYKRSTNRG